MWIPTACCRIAPVSHGAPPDTRASESALEEARGVRGGGGRAGEGGVEVGAEAVRGAVGRGEMAPLGGRLSLDRLSRLRRALHRARKKNLERGGGRSGGARPLLL